MRTGDTSIHIPFTLIGARKHTAIPLFLKAGDGLDLDILSALKDGDSPGRSRRTLHGSRRREGGLSRVTGIRRVPRDMRRDDLTNADEQQWASMFFAALTSVCPGDNRLGSGTEKKL